MPASKRQHRRREPEPKIDLEELRNAGNMSGFGAMFADRVAPFPASLPPEAKTERGIPDQTYPELTDVRSTAPAIARPAETPPARGAPYAPLAASATRFVRRAVLAQDGHSLGEQSLYEALWKNAHPYRDDARILTVGYRQMSGIAQLTVNNCKANIESLTEKLAVEAIGESSHTQGRTYLIHSYQSILQRRRAAGLTHYLKTRGVVFVDPDTGAPLTDRKRTRGTLPLSTSPLQTSPETTAPEPAEKGRPHPVDRGLPDSEAHLNSQFSSNPGEEVQHHQLCQLLEQMMLKPPTSTDRDELRTAMREAPHEAVLAGMYLTALRARGAGKSPQSFAYFIPEIHRARKNMPGVIDKSGYIDHLRRKWDTDHTSTSV